MVGHLIAVRTVVGENILEAFLAVHTVVGENILEVLAVNRVSGQSNKGSNRTRGKIEQGVKSNKGSNRISFGFF